MQTAMEMWFDKAQFCTPQQYYAAGMAASTYAPRINDVKLLGDNKIVMAYLYFAKKGGIDPSLLSQVQNWGKTV